MKAERGYIQVAMPFRRSGSSGVSVLMPSQGAIYGHYGGLFLAIVMDFAQLLSIMEKDGHLNQARIASNALTLH